MTITQTKTSLQEKYRMVCKQIKQANRGLPHQTSIDPNYVLILQGDVPLYPNVRYTMQIKYIDGDGKQMVHSIAL